MTGLLLTLHLFGAASAGRELSLAPRLAPPVLSMGSGAGGFSVPDPHAGSVSPLEVGAGALAVLGTDILSVGMGIGAFFLFRGASSSSGEFALTLAVLLGWGLDFVVTPIAAGHGANLAG